MTVKSLWLMIAFIALFTLAFLFETLLMIATVGLYGVFMPDKKLLMHKVKLWGLRTQLKYEFRNSKDTNIHNLIDKIR